MNKRIYAIRSQEFIKIGVATDVKKRLAELQVGNPIRMFVEAASAPMQYYNKLESVLHRSHGGTHVGGEWFHMTIEEASALKTLLMNPEHLTALIDAVAWSDNDVAAYLHYREHNLSSPGVC